MGVAGQGTALGVKGQNSEFQSTTASDAGGSSMEDAKAAAENELNKFLATLKKGPAKHLRKEIGEIIGYALAQVQRKRSLTRRTLFQRIQVQGTRNDPLLGIYVGSFGPHMSEIVQLRRRFGRWEEDEGDDSDDDAFKKGEEGAEGDKGELKGTKCRAGSADGFEGRSRGEENMAEGGPYEYVEATKLTGDLNVPAGKVTFRAKIHRSLKLSGKGVFPEELGVIARYKGQGRIAETGFRNPQWIDGELLILDGQGGQPTNGAEMGFLFTSPQGRNVLILFNRLHLQTIRV
eukprot:TRINITY_DN4042_c0_g1_i1.p1 TRINITY_DN4042_c0_g1~~TRINITY_DN4042_c0_g1_i1.p1  ORF type:complete len:290 (+),score=72.23 TRINITY_DN4042_c0_g1_i1:46-915(+)